MLTTKLSVLEPFTLSDASAIKRAVLHGRTVRVGDLLDVAVKHFLLHRTRYFRFSRRTAVSLGRGVTLFESEQR